MITLMTFAMLNCGNSVKNKTTPDVTITSISVTSIDTLRQSKLCHLIIGISIGCVTLTLTILYYWSNVKRMLKKSESMTKLILPEDKLEPLKNQLDHEQLP